MPPRLPRSALFPYTTLFRSGVEPVDRLASALPEGTSLLDAPVLGSLHEAEGGTLRIFVGGPADLEDPQRRSEEHTSELQSPYELVCRLLLEKKKEKLERRRS